MSDIIELYNSKFIQEKTVGNNNFFNNAAEISESDKLQQKYISNVDFSKPENFAKFGSAEEYYKNCIKYISENYPYDSSTSKKLEWINSLNDLEYYIFSKEYPRASGYISLSGSQTLEVFSHVKNPEEKDAKTLIYNGSYLTNNTYIDFSEGITFEAWLKFENNSTSNILKVSGVEQEINGTFSDISLFNIVQEYDLDTNSIKLCITNGLDQKYYFLTKIAPNKWNHFAFFIKDGLAKLYINGKYTEEINDLDIELLKYKYMFFPLGLMIIKNTNIEVFDGLYDRSSIFKVGGGGKNCYDELRMWNGERSLEKIGRYWFTNIDGNDPYDSNNDKLLFYYKFNEGWDVEYRFVCLDSSGRKNDSEILNYSTSCAGIGSGIVDSGFDNTREEPDIIYRGINYSNTVKKFYDDKIKIGSSYDLENEHMLYKKLPGWITTEEEESSPKHLKQLIQIICSYYDDLYNKIKEITNYKEINYQSDPDKIYPFYDKIITSMGFDVGNLFNDVSFIEAVSSRNDTYIFSEKISKVKNLIYKNIYNNLSYILKSKGTQKSINSFLSSYALNEEIVKINLYGNGITSQLEDKRKTKIVKKKMLKLSAGNNITSPQHLEMKEYTVETSFIIENNSEPASVAGIITDNYLYYVTLEKLNNNQFKVSLNRYDGTVLNLASNIYNYSINTNDLWTICLRKRADKDSTVGDIGLINYSFNVYLINNSQEQPIEVSLDANYEASNNIIFYIGSTFLDTNVINTNFKFLYCNYWSEYLENKVVNIHNRDIFNYGNY